MPPGGELVCIRLRRKSQSQNLETPEVNCYVIDYAEHDGTIYFIL